MLDTLSPADAVNFNIDVVKAAEDIVSAIGAALGDTNRSVVVEVDNQLPVSLVYESSSHDHGGFGGSTLPKGSIGPVAFDVFGSRSSGFLTGTEGHVIYSFGSSQFHIHWDNPEIGGNSTDAQVVPPDPRYKIVAITGNGNQSQARFVIADLTHLPGATSVSSFVAPHSGPFVQSRFGTQGNFEVLAPTAAGLQHLFRNNDDPSMPWHRGAVLPGSVGTSAASLIESNYGTPGNLETVADQGGSLVFYFMDSSLKWQGPFPLSADGASIVGLTGRPALIQSRFGTQGNFEVLAPTAAGLQHLFRDNDAAGMPWHKGALLPNSAGIVGAALVESNYGAPGNLEVVADQGGTLVFYFMDATLKWQGPFPLSADGTPISGLTGSPAFVQSRFGKQGNFEVLVPTAAGLQHLFRDNDDPAMPWHRGSVLPNSGAVSAVSLIESNYGTPGNLEVVADQGGSLVFFFMDSSLKWQGPFPLSADGTPISGLAGL